MLVGETVMTWVVAPVFHNHEDPADAVRERELPSHMLLSPNICAGAGEAVKLITVGSSMAVAQSLIKVLPSVPVTIVSVYASPMVTLGETSNWICVVEVPQLTPVTAVIVKGPPGPVRIKSLPSLAMELHRIGSRISSVMKSAPQGTFA